MTDLYPNTRAERARNKKRNEDIVRLREMGWSYKKIAKALDVPVTTASGVVNRRSSAYAEWQKRQNQRTPAV